jgi:putative endonuclease
MDFVYILTNNRHSVLYVGVTNDLRRRHWEHLTKRNSSSFTARYNVHKIVFYEEFESIKRAIRREKYIKGKTRAWKVALVNTVNPFWLDLSKTLE